MSCVRSETLLIKIGRPVMINCRLVLTLGYGNSCQYRRFATHWQIKEYGNSCHSVAEVGSFSRVVRVNLLQQIHHR